LEYAAEMKAKFNASDFSVTFHIMAFITIIACSIVCCCLSV